MPAEKLRWQGDFRYAYGHPDSPKPKRKGIFGAFTKKRVAITDDALVYQEARGSGKNLWRGSGKNLWQEVFNIPRDVIQDVRHEQGNVTGSFLGWGSSDQFVIVKMVRDSKEYGVHFKAEGLTQQKDAFQFVDAVQELLSRR